MKRLAIAIGIGLTLALCTIAVHARTSQDGSRPLVPGSFVKVPHLAAQPTSATPHMTRAAALTAVAQYWPSVAVSVPKSVQFGLVHLHTATGNGPQTVWIVAYSVDLPPPSGGPPGALVGPPNIKTMEFIVDDATGTVIEATGYFD